MWSFVLYLCLAVLGPALAQKKPMSRHQLELKEHYEHLAKIAEFECDQPQQRLIHVQELLSDFEMRGKAYFPEVTVLHRCDKHVGSCNDATHQCGPTHSEDIKLPFKVTFLEEMAGHAKGEWQMEYYTLQNHTSCGCLKYEGPPPSKTAVHYHYVDPSLVPPQSFLPLDSSTQTQSNASSYEVPVYPQPEGGYTPSIYDVTKMAEENIKPQAVQDKTKPEEEVIPPVPETKPEEEVVPQVSGTPSDEYQGFPGYNPSVVVIPNDPDAPFNTVDTDEKADADATTIPSELIRLGNGDYEPRSARLSHSSESPYDSFLRQAS